MTIQEILEAHESRGASSRYGVAVVSCGCKEVFHGPDSHDAKATHRAHVARVLEQHEQEAKAAALEEAADAMDADASVHDPLRLKSDWIRIRAAQLRQETETR